MASLNSIFDRMFAEKLLQNNIETRKSFMLDSAELNAVKPSKDNLRTLFGKPIECFSEQIGTHPDFTDLDNEDTRYQYICSVFLDISGSTRLGTKFPLHEVRTYKNAIIRTAIEIFQAFDGHIHRLQGDAIFAFFGHRKMCKSDAIINALNAASMMQSFNKYTLSDFFNSNNLQPLKIRIGIDIGDNHQVMWSKYGVGNVSEITSTSIHTDLAAKLQGKAKGNSIMLGENIYKFLHIPDEFLQTKTYIENGKTVEDKMVLSNPNYFMKMFNWERYLNSFSFLPKNNYSTYSSPEDFEILARVGSDLLNGVDYHANTRVIPKEFNIQFKLNPKNMRFNNVKWFVENRGDEAIKEDSSFFEMTDYEGRLICDQRTAYNGHHYMICRLYDVTNNLLAEDRFGIYVNDETIPFKELGPLSIGAGIR